MQAFLVYLTERPRVSWRLGMLYAVFAVALVVAGGTLLLLPIQASRLLGQPLSSPVSGPLLVIGMLHLSFGVGALALAWGSWQRRRWVDALSLTRGALLAVFFLAALGWARYLLV